MKKILVSFGAGALGGLVCSLLMWFLGYKGVTESFHISIAPSLTAAWLYPRIVWGGVYGLLFILPMFPTQFFVKGLLLGLVPAAVQLFVAYPLRADSGFMGMALGAYTPLYILGLSILWGVITSLSIKSAK